MPTAATTSSELNEAASIALISASDDRAAFKMREARNIKSLKAADRETWKEILLPKSGSGADRYGHFSLRGRFGFTSLT